MGKTVGRKAPLTLIERPRKSDMNPLMPQGCFCTLYIIYSFLRSKCYKQLTLTFLTRYIVPEAHNSERKNLPFPLQINPVKLKRQLADLKNFLPPSAPMGPR